MTTVKTLVSGGLLTPSGLSLSTKALTVLPSIDPTTYSLSSVVNFSEAVGNITLEALPDGSGISVTVDPSFPADYAGVYFVLRGSYEYKTNTTDTNVAVVYANNDPVPLEVTFTDSTPSPDKHYYYSIVALVHGASPNHFQYNPVTGFASAYRYQDHGMTEFMYERLPTHWRDNDTTGFLYNYIDIFGKLFGSVRSDIEAYGLTANSVDNVLLDHLQDLASIVDWEVNTELDGLIQRKEVKNITDVYRKKGRDAALEFLIQLITGWEIEFEHGYRRVAQDRRVKSFDPLDTYLVANIGAPELRSDRVSLGTILSYAGETVLVADTRARDITIELYDGTTYTTWLEVDDFTGSAATDQHYTVTESVGLISTITFGDGVNGAIPVVGETVCGSYWHGGDSGLYSPESTDSWLNAVGSRVLFSETDVSSALTTTLITKLRKIIARLKASYAIYEIVVYSTLSEEAPTASESYTETTEMVVFIRTNTPGHTTNTAGYVTYVR